MPPCLNFQIAAMHACLPDTILLKLIVKLVSELRSSGFETRLHQDEVGFRGGAHNASFHDFIGLQDFVELPLFAEVNHYFVELFPPGSEAKVFGIFKQ